MQTNTVKPQLQLVPGVKSRPQYPPVSLNMSAQYQVFIAQTGIAGEKADALLQPLKSGCEKSGQPFTVQTFHVLANGVSSDNSAISLVELPQKLARIPVSSAFYLAGNESFMWDVAALLKDAGFVEEQIHMLPPVSNKRRLFCTHCYAITEAVTQTPAVCRGCGRHLLVRDHFSKIHRAYVGVQIDAEDPADLPEKAEELS